MVLAEPLFGVSNFNTPNISRNNDVLITTMLMVLFGKPGVYPSYPELGMYIQRFFHGFEDEIDTTSLKKQLALQCSVLVDYVNDGTIDMNVVKNNEGKNVLLITTPTMENIPNNILVIGISTNSTGKVVYNYEIMKMAEM